MDKTFIKVHPVYPSSHGMQTEISINIDYIVSVGVHTIGNNAVITTTTDAILTEESAEDVMKMIRGRVINF